MRVYAISDVHIDYKENLEWLCDISNYDYKDDVIILAGDISHKINLVEKAFQILSKSFSEVLYVPGNHDLWIRGNECKDSFMKFKQIKEVADFYNVHMKPVNFCNIAIVPLYSWYDYSFGELSEELIYKWTDFIACNWKDYDAPKVNNYFTALNDEFLGERNKRIISFSHFLPSIKLMPEFIPNSMRYIYPVLGSNSLMRYIQELDSTIHIYGHSHVNVDKVENGVRYINNAFGYPREFRISAKKLKCVYEE
ncbi:metallophosphoesterase family protein [Clostridium felsineum]|uniref:metallophosphoesterase family protein n=1 Tax=Clostridium felsineum TaxID=36839 RepID=UPI0009C4B17A|nr:metallophosphoesterase [Clostridium felsineum]URZ01116.1 hypothetical protein CLAUR_011040 [Clostridium felsineum]URZ15842.1 hypothetical protein CLFE_018890 [Clostridium felsineum DSM 794]